MVRYINPRTIVDRLKSLDRNLKLVFIVLLLIVTGIITLNLVFLNQLKMQSGAYVKKIDALVNLDDTYRAIKDLHSFRLRYIISGNDEYLFAIDSLKSIIAYNIEIYLNDEPQDRQTVDLIEGLLIRKFELIEKSVELRKQQGEPAEQQMDYEKAGNIIISEINYLFDNLRSGDFATIEKMKSEVLQKSRNTIILNYTGIALFVVILSILFLLLHRNIKKYERTTEKLNINEQRLMVALQASNIGAWDWNLTDMSIKWHLNIHKVCGFKEDVKFSNQSDIFKNMLQADAKPVEDNFKKTLQDQNEDFYMQYRVRDEDRKLRFIEIRGKIYYDKNFKPQKFLGIIMNVTERVKAEELARENEIRYSALLSTMNDGLIYINKRGIIKFANPEACNIFDKTVEELTGKNIFQYITESGFNKYVLNDLIIGKDRKPFQVEGSVNGNSKKKHFILSCSVLKDAFDLPAGAVIVIMDITKLKEVEIQLQAAHHELRMFIYRTYHDLKGPVDTIKGLLEIAKADVNTENRQIINFIEASSNKLRDILIELIQTLSIKDKALELTPVDLRELINDVLRLISEKLDSENVEIRTDLKINTAITDKTLLSFILQHLIANAIKYRDKNKLKQMVDVSVMKSNGGLQMSISDNGVGIERQHITQIFDMFYRASSKSTGAGLGLYITKKCIQKLHGNIALSSEKGKGTTVDIYIPLEA